LPSELDVVAFAPHPDDAELFCAGTLLVAADRGLATAVVDLTEGELSTNPRAPGEREAATELLGLATRVALGLPDGELRACAEQREAVVDVLRELRPRVVLAPYGDDRHPDHAGAARLVTGACFLAGVGRLGAGSPHCPERVYRYMLHQPFEPSLVVDVSAVWERRRALFGAFASQVTGAGSPTGLNDGGFLAVLEARAVLYGAQSGVEHGEPLHVDGPLLVQALPEWERAPASTGAYRARL
jgi:bacillithiol biosynthesis deacetylase BshB1